MLQKIEAWRKEKQDRLEEARNLREYEELLDCTFTPAIAPSAPPPTVRSQSTPPPPPPQISLVRSDRLVRILLGPERKSKSVLPYEMREDNAMCADWRV